MRIRAPHCRASSQSGPYSDYMHTEFEILLDAPRTIGISPKTMEASCTPSAPSDGASAGKRPTHLDKMAAIGLGHAVVIAAAG